MANINQEILIPIMDEYMLFLEEQNREENCRLLSNIYEDYKRQVAEKAANILDQENWDENEIGTGTIGQRVIKAVQRNNNLIGQYQNSGFANKVREDPVATERVLFDLYHNHKEKDSFETICKLFGRKYDLVAYLYFIIDPKKYLPIRSAIFNDIFIKLGIELRTLNRCSWENYQDYLSTITNVRDAMREHFQSEEIDLLDAHAFLWTFNRNVLGKEQEKEEPDLEQHPIKEKVIEVGANVFHKDYGKGEIYDLSEDRVYVRFGEKERIFYYPEDFEKGYLWL